MAKEVINNIGPQHNVLTVGTKVVGNISTESDIRIDGELEGTLTCMGKVVVGKKGRIKGTINCTNIEIFGDVEGEIKVKDTLALRETGSITGEVKTAILLVEPKSIFNGSCSMSKTDPNKDQKKG